MSLSRLAIIPDGNRRFAAKNQLELSSAYAQGFGKVDDVRKWAAEAGVREMTFWALSLENLQKRSSMELEVLFRLMGKNINNAIESSELANSDARIKFFGRMDLLPEGLRGSMSRLEERTRDNDCFLLNIAVAYSGADELANASKRIAIDVREGRLQADSISQEVFAKYLYPVASPDLIIRTGDVQRLSGFLPVQSAYSEYYFSKKLWPEFAKEDFFDAVAYYDAVQRRFGK